MHGQEFCSLRTEELPYMPNFVLAIECFTANLAIMDWHWHRSVKSGAARIGNTWIVESPTAMESTEILTIDNCSYQSLRCCLINGCEWTNLGNRKYRLLQPLEHDRETKCRLVEKKNRVGCHRHIHGHGHHHNIHIKPTNPFFKKNAYDLAFTLNIISFYFPENSEITDWNTTSKGGRGSEHCYLFTV